MITMSKFYNPSILNNLQYWLGSYTTSLRVWGYRTAPLVTLAISALISFNASWSAFPSSYFLWAFASEMYDLYISSYPRQEPEQEGSKQDKEKKNTHSSCASCSKSGCSKTAISSTPSSIPWAFNCSASVVSTIAICDRLPSARRFWYRGSACYQHF